MKQLHILILLPAFLIGCSTYSKKQCQEMDWYVEGKKAALQGYTPKQGKTHFIDKCQEDQGVAIDYPEFERGFSAGLKKLCTPEGLKELEDKDIKYQRTCEAHEDLLKFQKTRTSDLEEKVHNLELENSRLKTENEKLKANACKEE